MFELITTPPFCYFLAVVIGIALGGGIQMILNGLTLFSLAKRFNIQRAFHFSISIFSLIIGFALIITGTAFFLWLSFEIFTIKADHIALGISLLLALFTSLALLSPLLLTRRRKNNIPLRIESTDTGTATLSSEGSNEK